MSDQCRMCPNCHTILLDDGACGHFGAANNGCGHHGEIVATRDPNGPVATAAVNNRCTRCGQIPPAIDSGLFELWDGALRWPDEQREAVIAQILSPRLQRQTWSGATVTPLQPAPQRAPPPQPPAPPPVRRRRSQLHCSCFPASYGCCVRPTPPRGSILSCLCHSFTLSCCLERWRNIRRHGRHTTGSGGSWRTSTVSSLRGHRASLDCCNRARSAI